MKLLITTLILTLVISYTQINFGMRSMADQPLTPTMPKYPQKQKIQQTPARKNSRTPRVYPEHHSAIRTPAGLFPIDTPLATTPDLEHDVHMIMPHIGKTVPRDYGRWNFE